MSIYNKYNETIKIYLDLNSTAPQQPQTYRLKINWNWGIFAWWNWSSWKVGKKDETIQCNHKRIRVNDKGLIASSEGFLLSHFYSGIRLLFPLAKIITQKFFKTSTVKQEKTWCN